MDFTLTQYTQLLKSLQYEGYFFQTFKESINAPEQKSIVLRHDVDLLPQNSLKFSKIQASMGIKGSYYFRAVPESWDEEVILEIAALGHEVGYHYENMDTCKGEVDKAWDDFRFHLDKLRALAEVKTICMHGSPRSPFDNKDIWTKYDYKQLGIIGEPYFDVDFDKTFYLTDTGRRWDGWKTSVRDKVPQQEAWIKQGLVFHTTNDIIKALKNSRTLSGVAERSDVLSLPKYRSGVEVPDKIMFTMHPQRWHKGGWPWIKELVFQRLKNEIKKVLVAREKT